MASLLKVSLDLIQIHAQEYANLKGSKGCGLIDMQPIRTRARLIQVSTNVTTKSFRDLENSLSWEYLPNI